MAKKKNKGWISLHRKITDNPMWVSKEPFDRRSAWIDLLLIVNHEERVIQLRNGEYVTVGVGQCFTSLDHLAKRWNWSRNRVDRYLKQLSGQGMCTRSGTPSGTLLTIVNYSFYQFGRDTNGATNGATDGTTDGATDGTRTTINNKNIITNNEIQDTTAKPRTGFFSYGDV